VAEVRHQWLNANPCLIGIGEDCQQGDGSGVKVNCLDPVCLQDRQEEGRYHTSEDGEEEEG
jgi:hypothetical protein